MQHEELFCCHSAEGVEEVRKAVEGDKQWKKSECDRRTGNDGTDPVCKSKRNKKQKAKIKDEIAVELVERFDYDFSRADKDSAMTYGVIARTIVLDRMVRQYLEKHENTVVRL